MNTTLPARVSIAAVCALLAAPAWTQTEDQPQREVEFVSGEARTVDRHDYAVRRCTVVATFETKPVLSRVRDHSITRNALGTVFGWEDPKSPDRSPTLADDRAVVDRKTVYSDDKARAADRWTIAAIDETTAKAVTEALLVSYAMAVRKVVEENRAASERYAKKCTQLQRRVDEYPAQIEANEEVCGRVGVGTFTLGTIDEAIARFDHEHRLNEVDIAGLNARLEATEERLNTAISEGNTAMRQALERIQVELQIELIGKLARKAALSRERQQLESARESRAKADKLRDNLAAARKELPKNERMLSVYRSKVQELEQLANFAVTDNRVVISPILRTER